jgi:tyrosyl-tRNA synthetase
VLQVFRYHIFPRYERVEVRRPAKYGGDREFGEYAELERAYGVKEIHPLDLKKTAARYLTEMLYPVREYLR